MPVVLAVAHNVFVSIRSGDGMQEEIQEVTIALQQVSSHCKGGYVDHISDEESISCQIKVHTCRRTAATTVAETIIPAFLCLRQTYVAPPKHIYHFHVRFRFTSPSLVLHTHDHSLCNHIGTCITSFYLSVSASEQISTILQTGSLARKSIKFTNVQSQTPPAQTSLTAAWSRALISQLRRL